MSKKQEKEKEKEKEAIFYPVTIQWIALEKREQDAVINLIKHLEEIRKVKK